ncbi:tetratricopeptide repeat protein [Granulicella tundricola]|uniref:Tetratricopeptide TPR_1 repeat-containing protein n=1 Tax=Granulicella tundricola (strain ATCC BAA-1859 / DSM 23138 / MP5ACTX9) TaxID=1198114 RepID=E8X4D5_GRATM|nr:tetratricopeptide repeat protein [Granulicella tundricola]ADW68262.1 Tetratricopeptide TPR_1 repeat-containing protein [Granulicella tundricola MP5ACTX9]
MTLRSSAKHIVPVAALLLAAHAVMAQVKPAPVVPPAITDRSSAYYHDGLAHLYEEMAINNGRPDYATQAIEEYKLALNADPNSKYLQDGLADLYFKIGRIREAVTTAQEQVKKDSTDLSAHLLLGKVYLRSLNDMQGPQATEMLQLAIGEYEKIAQLQPKDLETHLILGQLYGLNHDSVKAEAEFKTAREIDSNSEEAVLSIARLYMEEGQPQRAVDVLGGIPADDRGSRTSAALGAAYDQLHKPKDAAKAYQESLDQEPDNVDTERALAAALLLDNQLDPALTVLKQIVAADPTDVQSTIHISEIQRRQGHYDEALVTLDKAKSLNTNSDNLELVFNEAVLYDSLGKYDQAIQTLQGVLASTKKTDGKYSEPEKSNRAIFLDRLGIVYGEESKTPEAITAYKEMVSMGGDYAIRGYQREIDTYRDAHQWKDAVAVGAEASAALPNDKSIQLTYAFQLADTGQVEKGLALANAQLKGGADDRDTLVAIANIDLRLKRSDDAMKQLDKAEALSAKPDDKAYVYLLRATVLDHDKHYDEAEAEYKKVLAIDPNNATVLNDLGYMQAERGIALPDALAMIQKAVTLDPQNGAFLDSLGWVQFKMGQYGPAETNLKKAIDRTASDPSIHDHLGQLYEKTGHLQQAVAQWERSMTEYARSLPADADPADVAKVKHNLEQARTKLARVGGAANKKS